MEEACDQAYPDLKQVFFELADRLDADPLILKVIRPSTGQEYSVVVNGDRLVNQFQGLLYFTDAIPTLPKMIYALWDGQTQAYAGMLGILFSSDYTSLGMTYSVQCAEEAPFTSADAIRSAAAKLSPRLRIALDNSSILRFCEIWNSHPAAAIENVPVSSNLPVLILAGEFDPITPPEWGRLAAETLPNAHFYEFPGMGHGILGQGTLNFDCSYEILDAFLAHPDSAPEGSCVSQYKLHFEK
jgi:pimeloyl-ACP methyl ester carboxylesterase